MAQIRQRSFTGLHICASWGICDKRLIPVADMRGRQSAAAYLGLTTTAKTFIKTQPDHSRIF